jgi:hypothetical protein
MSPLTGDRGRLQGPHLSFRMRQHGVHSCGTSARSSALYPLLRDWRGGREVRRLLDRGAPADSQWVVRALARTQTVACLLARMEADPEGEHVRCGAFVGGLCQTRLVSLKTAGLLECFGIFVVELAMPSIPPHGPYPLCFYSPPCSCWRPQPWSTSCTLWGCLRIRRALTRSPLCAAS